MNARHDGNNKVILSADIVGSTTLYEEAGDAAARRLVAECLRLLKQQVGAHHGRVLAEVGDEVVALFADPTQAASTASEVHASLLERYRDNERERIRMRIGLHYGPVPSNADALIGETTKIAHWASSNAKPEQTLATRALIDQLPRIFRAVSRYVDDETWNFVSQEHVELYEIIWDVEAITAYNGEKVARDAQAYDAIEFQYGGHAVRLTTARPVISIGRDANNDLVIPRDLVSRQHLSAQFSRGRCTITDNSTNGTAVVLEDGSRFELKRDSLRLAGDGSIVLGKPGVDEQDFTLRFRCLREPPPAPE